MVISYQLLRSHFSFSKGNKGNILYVHFRMFLFQLITVAC